MSPPRRAFLHIGEPKCGTTYLQDVVWANRRGLAAAGVSLPGVTAMDHYRAAQDLRGARPPEDDPQGSWEGEWDTLAAQARRARGDVLISHELLAGADAAAARRAVSSLAPAEVHLVVTARDYAALLPAEWQETIKHRQTWRWAFWLDQVVDHPDSSDRRVRWFWDVHDTVEVLRRWGEGLPAAQVHVVAVPPRGSAPTLLWERFAHVLGVDPVVADAADARPNTSLGVPETEMLRRLNLLLRGRLPGWFYLGRVKELLAHEALASRNSGVRLRLPDSRFAWAQERSDARIAGLQQAGYDFVGEWDDLRPVAPPDTEGAMWPAFVRDRDVLDAALDCLAEVLVDEYAASGGRHLGPGRGGRLQQVARKVRAGTTRHPAARRAASAVWRQVAERVRR